MDELVKEFRVKRVFFTFTSCTSLLALLLSSSSTACTLLTAADQCSAVRPLLSVASMSTSALMSSSAMSSIARRHAQMSGVLPSCDLAFRVVERLRSKIWRKEYLFVEVLGNKQEFDQNVMK